MGIMICGLNGTGKVRWEKFMPLHRIYQYKQTLPRFASQLIVMKKQ